jgi:hypothetical protein
MVTVNYIMNFFQKDTLKVNIILKTQQAQNNFTIHLP